MSDENTGVTGLLPRQVERWQALVDILFLNQVVFLYIFSAIYPFMGLFYGIVLLVGSVSPSAKKIGRVCLILGIINTALSIIAAVVFVALGLTGLLAGLAD